MAVPTKLVVFCALLSVVSSDPFGDYLEKMLGEPKCFFELFEKDSPGFDGPPMDIDWKQLFIDNKMFKNETLSKVHSNPVLASELQIKIQNTIEEYSITAGKAVRCAKIHADKIVGSMLEGKHLSGLEIIVSRDIDELTLKGNNLHDIKVGCSETRDSSIPCNARRIHISGKTVEKVSSMVSNNFTDSTVNAVFLAKLMIFAKAFLRNKISATDGLYGVSVAGDSVINTHVESFHISELDIVASAMSNTHINGTILNHVSLMGESSEGFINNTYIEGYMLRSVLIAGRATTNNVVIKAKTLERVGIGADGPVRNVDITASDNIEDLIIGSSYSTEIKNVKLNGVPIELEGRFQQLQCSDKLGYPDDDAELRGLRKCFSGYCKSMCNASGHETGKCIGRTCCCMK